MSISQPLECLPVYGPRALSFPDPAAFREGFVVEFFPESDLAWIGNFARFDDNGLDTICENLGPHSVVIVAGGSGYAIDVTTRELVREFSFGIAHLWFDDGLQAIVLSNGLWFEAFSADGMLWRSPRISFDGIRNLKQTGLNLHGEAYDPTSDEESWVPFSLDLATGKVAGGSFPMM